MWPRVEFDLPIFGADIVGGRQRLSMGIVDLSPAPVLPSAYGAIAAISERHDAQGRCELPSWASIFSDHCVFVRPESSADADEFVRVLRAYLEFHLAHQVLAQPQPERRHAIASAHRRYGAHQLQNDRTRRVLAATFGDTWAARYMETILFDTAALE
jgi:phycocyanobilin:ferredoxin oxidoreductase